MVYLKKNELTNIKKYCKKNNDHLFWFFLKSATANPYVVYKAQTQQSTMTTPSNITSPSGYPMTLHPPPQEAEYPQTTENKFSNPPPSYDSLMESSTSHVYDAIQESSKTN